MVATEPPDSDNLCSDNSPAILYRNDLSTIFIIDIPRSIELAQSYDRITGHKRLLSSNPLRVPFLSNEPKTAAGRDRLAGQMSLEFLDLHKARAQIISEALSEIRRNAHLGSWCLPRVVQGWKQDEEPDFRRTESPLDTKQNQTHVPPIILSSSTNHFPSVSSLSSSLSVNPFSTTTSIQSLLYQTYIIPPQSAFMIGDINTSNIIMSSNANVLLRGAEYCEAGCFDLILLDPPWANRSVKRSKSYAYDFNLATLGPFLTQHVSGSGFVGIWVTNKEAIQSKAHRLMADCGFEIFEEWLWIKTTIRGEPVTELNGLWRRPYEVFLLFRRPFQRSAKIDNSKTESAIGVLRRVIAAVPDLHSRKPSLKELVESLILPLCGRRVLEIFARHLTAGWWAWGDEVLKFNWEGHWIRQTSELNDISS